VLPSRGGLGKPKAKHFIMIFLVQETEKPLFALVKTCTFQHNFTLSSQVFKRFGHFGGEGVGRRAVGLGEPGAITDLSWPRRLKSSVIASALARPAGFLRKGKTGDRTGMPAAS